MEMVIFGQCNILQGNYRVASALERFEASAWKYGSNHAVRLAVSPCVLYKRHQGDHRETAGSSCLVGVTISCFVFM